MINKTNLYFLYLFLAFFSVNDFFVNPVYILGVFLVVISFSFIKISSISKKSIVGFVFFLLTSLGFSLGFYFQDFYYKEISPNYLSSILFCYSILLGVFSYEIGRAVNFDSRKYVYRLVNISLLIFMALELISRLLNPDYSEYSFYKYKDSVLYYDSNFTGIILSVFLMFFVYLKKNKIYDIGNICFLIYFLFLILTISRASIFAFIFSYICVVFFGKYFKYFAVIVLSISLYFAIKMVNMYLNGESFIDIDGSFNSKFYIISQAIDLYGGLPILLKFFGIGLANFASYAGIFAHNIVVTFVFELGFFGSFLFIIYFIYLYYRTHGAILYILMPVLIGGFSLFSAYSAFLFILSSVILIESNFVKQVRN
ncbi:hypothetical protein FM020_15575 [Acinetobacter tandoii]|nr:hypothetical protein FM020_15575 [Acinetobacter tandoii]